MKLGASHVASQAVPALLGSNVSSSSIGSIVAFSQQNYGLSNTGSLCVILKVSPIELWRE